MADCFDDTDMPIEDINGEVVAADEDDEDFSLNLMRKKKKKKKKKPIEEEVADMTLNAAASDKKAWIGTDRDYAYTEMLERVFDLLRERNPGISTRKRHVMPPPQLVRVGTRKTMWANFNTISQLMHRQNEHVMSFVLAELGTEGSIDGNQRLVVKGRYVPKQIESLLKKYIMEYVTCHMCRSPETTLTRDSVTRLFFLQCETCGSRRSVAPIKSGFHATSRTDRRAAKQAAK
jgi:translation initiation factor 2 subunit 2